MTSTRIDSDESTGSIATYKNNCDRFSNRSVTRIRPVVRRGSWKGGSKRKIFEHGRCSRNNRGYRYAMFFSSYFVFTENGEMAVFAILWCAFSTGKEAKHRDDSEEIGKVLLLRIEHRLAYQLVFHQLAPPFPSYLYDFSRTAVFLSLSFAHSYPSDCPLIPWSLHTFPTCNCKITAKQASKRK